MVGMEIPGSPRLHDLALMALDHGTASAEDGPVIPFVVAEDASGKRSLARFSAGTLEASVQFAFDHAKTSDATRIAVCFDGFITLEDGRFDAVWVVAQERSDEAAITFYQRYRTAHSALGFAPIGNAGFAGDNDPLFAADEHHEG